MRKRIIHLVLAIGIVLIGIGIARHLILTRPHLKTRKRKAPIPMVRVERVKAKKHQIVVKEGGVVRAVKMIKLVPQVGGKIIYISPSFEEGKLFKAGELLVALDPSDYEVGVKLAQAEVKEAESRLAQILAEAKSSTEEWRSFAGAEPPPKLVAKKPQVEAAKARLKAARANLEKAKLNLERTKIYAPFDGRVLQKDVDIGEYVTPGKPLGIIYSTETVEVVVPLSLEKAKWIAIPGYNTVEKGSPVEVRLGNYVWKGRVWGVGGKVDEKTRLLPVIIRVDKPFDTKPPLLPGSYVEVFIKGKILKKAVVLPYSYLHQTSDSQWQVWTVDQENRVRFRKVKIAYMYENQVVITKGLKSGDLIITSELETVTDGMKVRVAK